MDSITPFAGWLLRHAVEIDDACPGLTVHLLRASAERRHVIAAYLSRQKPFRRFNAVADLGYFLMNAGHDEILNAAFGRVPSGLRAALGRAGPTPHRKRYYGYLHALLTSEARPEMMRLLQSLKRTDPKLLLIARALPPGARNPELVRAVQRTDTARDLARLVDLMERAGCDRTAMLAALAKATTMDDIRSWARRWAFKLNFPDHPVPATETYSPICRADDLRKLAVRYRNCARNYLTDVLDGQSAFATVSSGLEAAVVHLVCQNGQWWLDDIYGSRNAAPSKGVIEMTQSYLAGHGIFSLSKQPSNTRKWSCLRRFTGHFDYHDDWEAA